MVKPHGHRSGGGGRGTNCASCVVATIFLIFIVIILVVVYFTVFMPKDPEISVTAVRLPSFAVANNSVSFTFSQFAAVSNPNRDEFSHYDSTIQLLYYGNQVGFMFIPAGKMGSGQTQYMAATFTVQSFPLYPPSAATAAPGLGPGFDNGVGFPGNRVGPTLELESKTKLAGRVRVLHFFTHHVAAKSDCRVTVALNGGSVLGFHC